VIVDMFTNLRLMANKLGQHPKVFQGISIIPYQVSSAPRASSARVGSAPPAVVTRIFATRSSQGFPWRCCNLESTQQKLGISPTKMGIQHDLWFYDHQMWSSMDWSGKIFTGQMFVFSMNFMGDTHRSILQEADECRMPREKQNAPNFHPHE